MIGYGSKEPKVVWPNNAKLALQIVLNYEEGGENCLLHGDPASEAFLSEIVGAEQWIGKRHFNMESIYEYGARRGFWRLHDFFIKEKIPITVYGVATALARSPIQVSAMLKANWEIASHGYKWIEYKNFSKKKERNARTLLAIIVVWENRPGTETQTQACQRPNQPLSYFLTRQSRS